MVREFAPPAQTMFRAPANGARDSVTPFSSTFTPTVGLEVPARGDYPNQWDLPMDATLQTIDSMAGGTATITCTGGNQTINLTQAQANCAVLNLVGTLAGGWTVITYPAGYGAGRKWVIPQCGGMSPTTNYVYVRGNGGADTHGVYFWQAFGVPHPILVTPSRVYWDYGGSYVGEIKMFATGVIPNGHLPLDGRLVSQVAHDLLYSLYGTGFGSGSGVFGVPDCRGMVMAGADNMGTNGSRGILNNWGILGAGGPLGEANHTLAVSEMPPHAHPGSYDSGHSHGVTVTGHSHGANLLRFVGSGSNFGIGVTPGNVSAGNTDGNQDTVQIVAGNANLVIAGQGGGGAMNNVQPTRTCMACVRW